jgi:hypothetical protein
MGLNADDGKDFRISQDPLPQPEHLVMSASFAPGYQSPG